LRKSFADKKAVQKIVHEQNAEFGFVPDPTATPEKVQEMMLALGIRPEDNMASCGISAMPKPTRSFCAASTAERSTPVASPTPSQRRKRKSSTMPTSLC
jgi:hypothetical protein